MMKATVRTGIIGIFLLLSLPLLFVSCEEEKKESGQITIVNVSGPTKLSCGGFSWQVSFKLDPASPKGGWFVQKVTVDRKATVNCPAVYPPINLTYWEAWQVRAGKQVTTYLEANAKDYDDMFAAPSWPNSEGNHATLGNLKFFEELALPGEFVANNPKTYAGILPSTLTKPDFWDETDATDHNLTTDWDCCVESSMTLETVPDFTEKPKEPKPPKGGKFFEHVEPLKPWTSDSGYTQADNYLLVQFAMALSQLSDDEILSGVVAYSSYYAGDLDAMSKLFLLLRILYHVPESVPMEQTHSFGGWMRPIEDISGPTYDLLWPLGWKEPFQVPVVIHDFMGYLGGPYDATGELEYFMSAFGRR